MRFVCRTCGVVREAEDAPLQQASEIVCGSCGAAMTPDTGVTTARAPRSRTAALGLAEQWFVTDEKGRRGPYTAAQLARMLERGELGWTSQVWRDGLKDWRPARRDDLLVFAVASVRGMASDTSRLDAVGELMLQDDTRVEGERPERFVNEGERPERYAPDDLPGRIVGEAERTERFASAAASSVPAPASGSEQTGGAAEDTRRTVLPARPSWPLRHSTPLIAVGAFVAGALLTQLSHRLLPRAWRAERPASSASARPAIASISGATLPLLEARAVAPGLERTRPDEQELQAELTRLDAPVRRCVRRGGTLEISLVIDGDSGRVDPASVQVRGVRATRLACVMRVLSSLQVAPFVASEYALTHTYRW